jgi:hypothetical protein
MVPICCAESKEQYLPVHWVLLLGILHLGQYTLLGVAVGLCGGIVVGAFGNTLYWVFLVNVAPRATHFTGYCCWFMWGYCCWLCCAWGNTLYWVLLLVYEGPQTTEFTGFCCELCKVSGNTPYWVSLGLMQAAFINGFEIIFSKNNSRKVEVSVSVSSPKLLKRISPHKQNHMTLIPSFLIYKCATTWQISFTNLHLPRKPSGGRV